MKKLNKIMLSVIALAVISMTISFVGCKKEKAENIEVKTIKISDLPVFFNEKPAAAFVESEYTPTRGSDMKLTSVVDTVGIYYFDNRQIFENFCDRKQMQIVFENNFKLDSIYEKAVELGIVDNDDETIPQEMAEYWQDLFGTDLVSLSTQQERALIIKLYDGYHLDGQSLTTILPLRAKLGNMDNKTSSLTLQVSLGATVMCYEKWFGGTKRWYWLFGSRFDLSLENTVDDNQFSSYFCI